MTLPWQLLTGPAALAAAIAAGTLAGAVLSGPWTVPGVAIGLFLAHRPFFWNGYPELFTLETATAANSEFRPIAAHLMATVAINLVTLLGCAAAMVHASASGLRPRLALAVALLAFSVAMMIFLPWFLEHNHDTYEYVR